MQETDESGKINNALLLKTRVLEEENSKMKIKISHGL